MSIGLVVSGIVVFVFALYVFFRVGYLLGIKKEQQARIRRLAALRKLLGDGEV